MTIGEKRFVHGPTFAADYSWGELDGYTERGDPRANGVFGAQDFESLVTRLGWQINWEQETKWATLRPQLRLGYGRENLNDEQDISASLQNSPFSVVQGSTVTSTGNFGTELTVGEDPGEGWMEAGIGIAIDFNETFGIVLDYQGQFFRQDASAHFGSVRARVRF